MIAYHAGRWHRGEDPDPLSFLEDELDEEEPVAADDWSLKAQYVTTFLIGLAIVVILLSLIAWGYAGSQQGHRTDRARAEACSRGEGATAADIAVCIRAAG